VSRFSNPRDERREGMETGCEGKGGKKEENMESERMESNQIESNRWREWDGGNVGNFGQRVVGCIGGYGSGYDESLFAPFFFFQTLFPHPLQFQSPQLFPHYFLKSPKEKDGYGDI
jgi:hypothetical protein